MRIITVEEHFGSKRVSEEARAFRDPSLSDKRLSDDLAPLFTRASDVPGIYDHEERLRFMGDNGVSVQVLSYTNTVPKDLPADKAVYFNALANDELAKFVDANPGRFAAFATLPLQDPAAAATELERCVAQLGFKGAMLDAWFNGHGYEEEQYLPVFEKAAELDVPISLHPSFVDSRVADYYYKGPWDEMTEMMLGAAAFGWHLDVGMVLLRMVLAGVLDRVPSLKLITGHWGEVVAYYLDRMQMLAPERTGLAKPIADYYRESVWVTPSGMLSRANMEYCLKMFGVDHVLWALDYPYLPLKDSHRWLLENDALSAEDKEKIAHLNAEKLLRL